MNRFKAFVARLMGKDRRRENVPVTEERRQANRRISPLEANRRVLEAMKDFEETVASARGNKPMEFRASNDLQQVVQFPTLQHICRFRGPDALRVRICRHERHQDAANTQLAICEEGKCPIILEALKMPA